MTELPDEVENRYRSALGGALPDARWQVSRVANAFRTTQLAMQAGAWQSPVADAFSQACADAVAAARDAAEDCVDALESRHAREPREVSRNDPRAYRW